MAGRTTAFAGLGRGLKRSGLRLAALALLALALGMASAPVRAQQDASPAERTVLLELFTSQGCASCPPADDMLAMLATREDVVALALHVDYWDYIGWPDTFASPAHTDRQQAYARRHGHSTIYTPQVIINGQEMIEGFRTMEVIDAIARHHARPLEVDITLERGPNGGLRLRAAPAAGVQALAMTSRRSGASAHGNAAVGTLSLAPALSVADAMAGTVDAEDDASLRPAAPPPELVPVAELGPFVVSLARYTPAAAVDILGGENAGRTIVYTNVVTQLVPIANWDMRHPLEMTLPLEGEDPVVVLVQEVGQGEVLGVARLR